MRTSNSIRLLSYRTDPPFTLLMELSIGLIIVLCLSAPFATAQQTTYPENVHRLVVERLRQRSGDGGTWGEWSAWTPCSKSCGSGVSIQSRECLMNPRQRARNKRQSTPSKSRGGGGSRCVGLYKRFQLCNIQDCPNGYSDFRWEQCASFNKTPFNRRYYTWAPYYDSPDSCALNCRAVGLSFYATLNQTVIDGTRCGINDGTQICVAGRCMAIGCDGILGSNRYYDSCGICGGNNSTCRIIHGVYSRAKMPYGYNVIATLPTGASNITIQHTRPSTNYLALRHQAGDFFLNGNWAINASGGYEAAGTVFSYYRPERFQGDMVTAPGPLHHPVDVLLFYQSTNPGIKYEYRLPVSPSRQRPGANVVPGTPQRPIRPDNPLNPFVPGGPAARTPPSGPVNDAQSNNYGNSVLFNGRLDKKEEEEKKKKRKERKGKKGGRIGHKGKGALGKRRKRYEWKVVGFTSCTETCGGGTQTTRVVCVKRKRGNEVPDKHCVSLPKPVEDTVRCNLRPCPAQWIPEDWGACSVTCGLGVQTRRLSCKIRMSPDNYIVSPEAACPVSSSIPKAQVCELPSCNSGPSWKIGEWGQCSAQCGLGTRHRPVACVTLKGPVAEHLCTEEKPSNKELCDMGSCATDTWFFSPWEDRCSEECGEGVQRRRVHCSGDALDNQVTETSCDPEQTPTTTRACTSDKGCGGKWFTGPWSDCNSECGPGRKSRAVVCVEWIRGRWKVTGDISKCKAIPRPETTEGCVTPCPHQWYTSEWSQCSASCEGGVQRREVKCLNEKQESALDCTAADKPDTRQPCNTHSCNEQQADSDSSNSSVKTESPPKVPNPQGDNLNKKSSGNVEYLETRGRPLEVTRPGVDTVNASTHNRHYDETDRESRIQSGTHGTATYDAGRSSYSGKSPITDGVNDDNSNNISNLDSRYVGINEETEDLKSEEDDRKPHPNSPLRPGRPWRPGLPTSPPVSCINRMKNCHLVYKARLCRLKYYNKLCCETCTKNQ